MAKYNYRVTGARGARYECSTLKEAKRLAGKYGLIERIGGKRANPCGCGPSCGCAPCRAKYANPRGARREVETDGGFAFELEVPKGSNGTGEFEGWLTSYQGEPPMRPTPIIANIFSDGALVFSKTHLSPGQSSYPTNAGNITRDPYGVGFGVVADVETIEVVKGPHKGFKGKFVRKGRDRHVTIGDPVTGQTLRVPFNNVVRYVEWG